jgi:hypothetical protein
MLVAAVVDMSRRTPAGLVRQFPGTGFESQEGGAVNERDDFRRMLARQAEAEEAII